MTKHSSIRYISGLLDNPGTIADEDHMAIASLRQAFPYFVPVRYIEAMAAHKKERFAPAMLSAARPYMGDWMMFADMLHRSEKTLAKNAKQVKEDVVKREFDNKTADAPASQPKENTAKPEVAKQADLLSPTSLQQKNEAERPLVQEHTAVEPKPVTEEIHAAAIMQPANIQEETIPAKAEETIIEAKAELIADLPLVDTHLSDPGQLLNLQAPLAAVSTPAETVVDAIVPHPVAQPAEIAAPVEKPANQPDEVVTEEIVMAIEPPVALLHSEDVTPANATKPEADEDPFAALLGKESPRVMDKKSVDVHTTITDQQEPLKPVDTIVTPASADTTAPDVAAAHWIVEAEANEVSDALKENIDEVIENIDAPANAEGSVSGQAAVDVNEKPLIQPVFTNDYFLQQGVKVSADIPADMEERKAKTAAEEKAKSLMVMMSFSEWLMHFKSSTEKQKEEKKDQKALKSMWQKEKLAAAMEEENEEIPENVFEMAVNSITKEDGLASESLAEIYIKQEKYDKAIEMYRKLSLRNPQKNAYFARKIEEVLKEKQS